MIIIVVILVAVGFELLVCFSQLGEYPGCYELEYQGPIFC